MGGQIAGVVAALSFWQTVLSDFLQVLFTAILVGVAAAIVVAVFQQRAATRRDALERDLQIQRAQFAVKTDFVKRTSDLAGSFFFKTMAYSRYKQEPGQWTHDPFELDKSYVLWAADSESIETELRIRYGWDEKPADLWHQIRDLLTVRYYNLRDHDSPKLREINATDYDGKFHSGLTSEQLRDMQLVVHTFLEAQKALSTALLGCVPSV